MGITAQAVVFDTADLAAERSFRSGALGGTVDRGDDWHLVVVEGRPQVGVQLAPAHVASDRPDGAPVQQIHLDLSVDEVPAAYDVVMSLGVTVRKQAERNDAPDALQVDADPAGHPFCVCWVETR